MAAESRAQQAVHTGAPRATDEDVSSSQRPEHQLVLAAADSSASCADGGAAGAPDGSEATVTKKASSKPQTERRRRQRINQCVGLLKNLVLEAMGKDPSQYTKLEKADVLDMAVRYVQTLREQQQQRPQDGRTPQSTSTIFTSVVDAPTKTESGVSAYEAAASVKQRQFNSPLLLYNPVGRGNYNESFSHPQPTSPQYHAGFSQCSSEIELYLRMLKNVPGDLPDKVASHLNSLLTKIKSEASESEAVKEPAKLTGLSPSIQPILLLLNPISTAPIPTVQMVGPLASDPQVQVASNTVTSPLLQERSLFHPVHSNEEIPQESHSLHSNPNQLDISPASSSALGCHSMSSRNTPSMSIDGSTTPNLSPCHSVMSDKSSVGYFYFSDDTDQTASPEMVTMYRCDESFSGDSVHSEPQHRMPTPGTSASCPPSGPSHLTTNLTSSLRDDPMARHSSADQIGHPEHSAQPSCSSNERHNSNSSENSLQGNQALHSRALQERELSTMWRPWHN